MRNHHCERCQAGSLTARAVLVLGLLLPSSAPAAAPPKGDAAADSLVRFNARSRQQVAPGGGVWEVIERPTKWDARQTAVVVIDVWNAHWCDGANRRVGEMVGRMNALTEAMRAKGALIVHAPSDTMKAYEGTPGRKLAQSAPAAKADLEFKWNYLDPAAEGKLPVDDSDGGCDCEPQCPQPNGKDRPWPWTGQHAAIKIADGDAVSDNGQEVYNLLEQRGIKNVLIYGVHTNMCVLGRSFGIRQMTRLGKNVLLVRDLTDTMYNPRMPPFVPHARGTDLVVGHVESHWCPTILSSDVLGDAKPAHVVLVTAEQEYGAKDTVPAFAKAQLEKLGLKCTLVNSDSTSDVPGLEALEQADLLVLYARRRTLPNHQLKRFKAYFDAGKPVVALRTSSHAFQNWLEFDKLVLGGNYQGHHGGGGPEVRVSMVDGAAGHPLLRGVEPFTSASSLYKASPLGQQTATLLMGTRNDHPAEPVAWTNTYKGGRVFYTSLGGREDFDNPHFRRLLTNGILWALDRPVPKGE